MKKFFTSSFTTFTFSIAIASFALLYGPTFVLAAEATLLKDINPGSGESLPAYLATIGSTVFFIATDPINGEELWKSDGTEAGTVLVKDICLGSGGSFDSTPVASSFGDMIYFEADDCVSDGVLWKTDGTEVGTVIVKEGVGVGGFLAVGATLYFSGSDASGSELWKTDGTEVGTVLVKDVYPGFPSGDVENFFSIGSTVYFSARSGAFGLELWKSDGTEAGTAMVKDIYSGGSNSFPIPLAAIGSTLFFKADDGLNGAELWKSDGTASGTVMVKDIRPGSSGSFINEAVVLGGNLYFGADANNSTRELWRSDGTEAGTVLVKTSACDAGNFFLIGSVIYFTACLDGTVGEELWKSDGTTDGTVMIKDITTGGSGSGISGLTAIGSTLFFSAYNGGAGRELWRSDGTESGTVLAADINAGTGGSDPTGIVALGDKIFLFADTPTYGYEPYIITFGDEVSTPPPPRSGGGGGGGSRKPKVKPPVVPVVVTTPAVNTPVVTTPGGIKLNPAVYDLIMKNKAVFEAARKMGIQLPAFILDILNTPATTVVTEVKDLYKRNLTIGVQGQDVRELQTALIRQNKGPKAVILGMSTPDGYFGITTRDALAEYQAKSGIVPAAGYFGPLTRAYMKNKGVLSLWW